MPASGPELGPEGFSSAGLWVPFRPSRARTFRGPIIDERQPLRSLVSRLRLHEDCGLFKWRRVQAPSLYGPPASSPMTTIASLSRSIRPSLTVASEGSLIRTDNFRSGAVA